MCLCSNSSRGGTVPAWDGPVLISTALLGGGCMGFSGLVAVGQQAVDSFPLRFAGATEYFVPLSKYVIVFSWSIQR